MSNNELKITSHEFKLIKGFYSEFIRKPGIKSNDYIIGWSELMPVVEEIESIEEPVSLNPERGTYWPYWIKRCKKAVEVYNDDQILFGVGGNDIKSMHKAVVEFIKWYNQQTK